MGRGQARPQRRTDEIVLGLPETYSNSLRSSVYICKVIRNYHHENGKRNSNVRGFDSRKA